MFKLIKLHLYPIMSVEQIAMCNVVMRLNWATLQEWITKKNNYRNLKWYATLCQDTSLCMTLLARGVMHSDVSCPKNNTQQTWEWNLRISDQVLAQRRRYCWFYWFDIFIVNRSTMSYQHTVEHSGQSPQTHRHHSTTMSMDNLDWPDGHPNKNTCLGPWKSISSA